MSRDAAAVTVVIDNASYAVGRDATILRAAQEHGIYIPTLCAHRELTPHGGCRLCIVEVEGVRSFPTACTTPVADGMVVRTDTAQLRAARLDILQLLLSEHTSSCLVCDEQEECRAYSPTIRKAGVTTGCRTCPKDGQCELQEVAGRLGVRELGYPVHYRGMRIEDEDPFYDRDHNLCVLCGRCVRVCQEVRVADVLGFKHRGRATVVGPAFDRTHLEAGCEFCGACITLCPTGALMEKARKWEGKAEREERTTCPFCGLGCRMRLRVKEGRVIGSVPDEDSCAGEGQLCVRGRFCVTELVNDPKRLRRPARGCGGTRAEITWEEAVGLAAERIAACPPGGFRMLVSPNLTNEDLYVAQKLARAAAGANAVDTSARAFYGRAFDAYLDLVRMGVPLAAVREASVILCVGLDTRFGRSVVGVELRRAVRGGRAVVTVHSRAHNLTLIADRWLRPAPGGELELLAELARLTGEPGGRRGEAAAAARDGGPAGEELAAVARMLASAVAPVILVGSELLQRTQAARILEAIAALARNVGAGVLPLPAQNNLLGSILVGACPGLPPGGRPAGDARAGAPAVEEGVLYLVGEVLLPDAPRPRDFLIYQNIYPMEPPHEADLYLPAAAFSEVDGTVVNGEGRLLEVRKAVDPEAGSLPDWEILCRIARRMGREGFGFASAAEVREEIAHVVEGFGDPGAARRAAGRLAGAQTPAAPREEGGEAPFVLTATAMEHVHRGFSLSTWVEGAERIFPGGVVEMSRRDARGAGIAEGDEVIVSGPGFRRRWRARIAEGQAEGELHVTLRSGESVAHNPCRARIEKAAPGKSDV